MKNLRKKMLLICTASFIALIAFQSLAPMPDPDPDDVPEFEQDPPFITHIYVQKIDEQVDGTNMIMKIQYDADERMAERIKLYHTDESTYFVFHDDGVAPDVEEGDHIYSAYIKEDLEAFAENMNSIEGTAVNDSGFLYFTGHDGELIKDFATFDWDNFNAGSTVELNLQLISAADCSSELKKQNSLFVTDTLVVEDPIRTYNVFANTGNNQGAWTFQTLMSNAAGGSSYAKSFIKSLVKHWMVEDTINGQIVPSRPEVMRFLIRPWLQKANNNSSLVVADTNWESIWDNTASSGILSKAPFKLMAIVNRMDLHGNSTYVNPLANTGETRFIFTLIVPFDNLFNQIGTPGEPPQNTFNNFAAQSFNSDVRDWTGLNIILEYANPPGTRCDMRALAQRWLDLSALTLGSEEYNDSLQNLTDLVTSLNAAPGNPNGSTLMRIRTNERIFFPSATGSPSSWRASDWEMRQFQIDGTSHLLVSAPVSNTPVTGANAIRTLQVDRGSLMEQEYFNTYMTSSANDLIDWVYSSFYNRAKISHGTHNIPNEMLAGVATLEGEYAHAWDLNWDATGTSNYDKNNLPTISGNSSYDKQLRQQISLNTCQGCHAGETKTIFTQVRPMGFGQRARYWSNSISDYTTTGLIDQRGGFNDGQSEDENSPGNYVLNYKQPVDGSNFQYLVNISAFLTGRNYRGTVGDGTFQDDKVDDPNNPVEDNTDSLMTGLFWVYDPTNRYNLSGGTFPYTDNTYDNQSWKYNDLEMRKQKLCTLVRTLCGNSGSTVIELATQGPLQPPMVGAH